MIRTRKILQEHNDRVTANYDRAIADSVLCDELRKELEIELLPPLPRIIEIPPLPHRASALPTDWVRTSLFASVTKTSAKYISNQVLESYEDIKIEFTGEQLNMFDSDVYLELVRLSQNRTPGEKTLFTRHAFLRNLGITGGNNNYKALKASLQRLKAASIKIETYDAGRPFNLVEDFSWDKNSGYWIILGRAAIDIYSQSHLSYIDLKARRLLSSPLAKYLQNYISGAGAIEQKVKARKLISLSGTPGQFKDFLRPRRGLPKALENLMSAGLISNYTIEKNLDGESIVTWNKIPHSKSNKSQKRA